MTMRGLAHINFKTSQLHPTKKPIKPVVNQPFRWILKHAAGLNQPSCISFPLILPLIPRIKLHNPFNTIFIPEHTGVCTPRTVANRPFDLSSG